MPAIQLLKKKLRGIRSTQKLSKAMKTAASIKFSRLNSVYNEYSEYGKNCREIYEKYKKELNEAVASVKKDAPECIIVMSSNKGLCGNFNSQIFSFLEEMLKASESPKVLIPCGKKAMAYFSEKGIECSRSFLFSDVPTLSESTAALNEILEMRKTGEISGVKLIYPEYVNMLKQTPCERELFSREEKYSAGEALLFPDKETVISGIAPKIFASLFYETVLESALGAQCATLMTMRKAYDTASEYSLALEGEINRKRQSAVTADVIETSSECEE